MNNLIKQYFQEKIELDNNPESKKYWILYGKEMLSIAKAIKSVFESMKEEKTPEDVKAYKWALDEIAFRGEDFI